MIVERGLGRAMLVGPLPMAEAQALRQAAVEAGATAVLVSPGRTPGPGACGSGGDGAGRETAEACGERWRRGRRADAGRAGRRGRSRDGACFGRVTESSRWGNGR